MKFLTHTTVLVDRTNLPVLHIKSLNNINTHWAQGRVWRRTSPATYTHLSSSNINPFSLSTHWSLKKGVVFTETLRYSHLRSNKVNLAYDDMGVKLLFSLQSQSDIRRYLLLVHFYNLHRYAIMEQTLLQVSSYRLLTLLTATSTTGRRPRLKPALLGTNVLINL